MHDRFEARVIGNGGARGEHARLADRLVLHGEPLDIRALLAQVVTERTRYLILDLDRTLHFGHNMGELLGWELAALRCYGAAHLARVADERPSGRFFLDRRRPLGVCRYLARGAAAWAYPGLHYLWWGKLGPRSPQVVRQRYLRFGAEPHQAVQRIPTVALLHDLAGVPLATARELARGVFRRHWRDQVIDRDDIAWLRQRYPNLVIVLSSASPQPVVEAAGAEIGVDVLDYTSLEVRDGYLSSPHRLHPLYLAPRLPRHICPPVAFVINAGHAKVERLAARFPDFLSPETETVGVSDTSHGEDHPWAQYLTRVVDINSPAPFPPLVAASSPLREVHSAQVLTRAERDARDGQRPAALDERRRRLGGPDARQSLTRADLAVRLGRVKDAVEALAERHAQLAEDLAPVRRQLEAELESLATEMGAIVGEYNRAAQGDRRAWRDELYRCLRAEQLATRRAHRRLRPLLELRCAIDVQLGESRRLAAQAPAHRVGRQLAATLT